MSGHIYKNETLPCIICKKPVTFEGCKPVNLDLPPFVSLPAGTWIAAAVDEGRFIFVLVCSKECIEKLPAQETSALQTPPEGP